MTRRLPPLAAIALAVVVALCSDRSRSRLAADEPTPEQAKFFTDKVRPIFKQNCY